MRSRPASIIFGMLGASMLACVFGYRGEVEFEGDAELSGIDTVALHLPPTALTIIGEPDRDAIAWEGRWISLGASSDEALEGARQAALVWESWASIGRLRADLPLDVRDLTSLESLEVRTAAAVAHEIVGAGNVIVSGIDAFVSVELAGGDVTIDGGLEQLRVHTERGEVDLQTAAAVDVVSGVGPVRVSSEADGAVLIDAAGPVILELAQLADLDIDIADAGPILVQLGDIAHVGSGSYRRRVGLGTRQLRIRADGARVELREQ